MAEYFTSVEEEAVEAFNRAETDAERIKIYEEKLHKAMSHLAECVLHRNQFPYFVAKYGDEMAQQMLLSFFVEILPKFTKERGKCFSFLTFCGRHYLIQQNNEAYADTKRLIPIETEGRENDNGVTMERILPEPLVTRDEVQGIDTKEFLRLCADYWELNRKHVCKKPRHHIILDELLNVMRNPDVVEFSKQTKGGKKQILKHFATTMKMKPQQMRPFIRSIKNKQNELLVEYINTGTLSVK